MNNHHYSFGGKYYKQNKGGAIGLKLTGLVCRVVMDRWSRLIKKIMDQAMWKCYLFKKYVDDINVIFEALSPGYRFINGSLRWKECYKSEDLRGKVSTNKINMELFRQIASSIFPTLTFTMDIPEDNPNQKVAVLDICVWKDKVKDCNKEGGTREIITHE